MSIRLQMIGTGDAFSKRFYNNNALIFTDDYTLLIDCGTTASIALHEAGMSIADIDGILITHQHSDHIGGLEEFAFQLLYVHNKKISLFVPEILITPLWEHSLKGGLSNGLADCDLHTYFNVVPLSEHKLNDLSPHLNIEIMQTDHIPNKPSYSLIINELLFYSADMTFNRPLLEKLITDEKCRYIVHECQLVHHSEVHTNLSELLTLPNEIQEKIQLMHYHDRMPEYISKTGKMTFLEQQKLYYYD